MRVLSIPVAALGLALSVSAVNADDDIDTAPIIQLAHTVCETCHGVGGSSMSSLFPRLAGQQAPYLEAQLKKFRARTRGNPQAQAYMWGIAGPLRDYQITELARFFSSNPPAAGIPSSSPEQVARGKVIFENGIEATNVPACNACHGENAEGNDTIPRLAGQHVDYLMRQIVAFRTETRKSGVMHPNAENLTDAEAEAVAEYLGQK